MNPSSRCDTIRFVLELSFIELIKLLENGSLEQLRMKSGYTVDSVRAHNREVSHSDLLWPSLFNQTHSLNLLVVTWVFLLQLLDIHVVDVEDKLQVSWQESADQLN